MLNRLGVWILESILKKMFSAFLVAYDKWSLFKKEQAVEKDNLEALKKAEAEGDLDEIAKAGSDLLNGNHKP